MITHPKKIKKRNTKINGTPKLVLKEAVYFWESYMKQNIAQIT